MTLTETVVDLSILQTLYSNEISPVANSKKRGKSVSFCKQLEKVRYYRTEEPAMNVRTTGLPKDVLPFFSIRSNACRLRSAHDIASRIKTEGVIVDTVLLRYPFLEGHVFVHNFSFHKRVTIRYTSDDWRTQTELDAKYESSDQPHQMDRFIFFMDVSGYFQNSAMASRADIEKNMTFCVKYECDGTVFWDSNGGNNYRIDFISQKPNNNNNNATGSSSPSISTPTTPTAPILGSPTISILSKNLSNNFATFESSQQQQSQQQPQPQQAGSYVAFGLATTMPLDSSKNGAEVANTNLTLTTLTPESSSSNSSSYSSSPSFASPINNSFAARAPSPSASSSSSSVRSSSPSSSSILSPINTTTTTTPPTAVPSTSTFSFTLSNKAKTNPLASPTSGFAPVTSSFASSLAAASANNNQNNTTTTSSFSSSSPPHPSSTSSSAIPIKNSALKDSSRTYNHSYSHSYSTPAPIPNSPSNLSYLATSPSNLSYLSSSSPSSFYLTGNPNYLSSSAPSSALKAASSPNGQLVFSLGNLKISPASSSTSTPLPIPAKRIDDRTEDFFRHNVSPISQIF